MSAKSHIPTTPGPLRVLRIGLLFSTVGWSISFFFTFVPWNMAADQLATMGLTGLEYHPLLDYWLKMASAVFGCVGVASAVAAVRPQAHPGLVRMLGVFHAFVGAVLVAAARANHLQPDLHPTFRIDIAFCFSTAALILLPIFIARPKPPAG